ncbi:hypothetical protein SDC9_143068 [bioreactor metagenome]|uniref:NfeD-like C-terminal domain-containing protein n=1 Tax=bioreactor metagenome TaxID=1076179 RepID=A0A645E5S3_9ZZZZ
MQYLWIALTVILIIIEAATTQLVTIWFAAGAVAAFIASLCHLSVIWQAVIFTVVSVVSLIVTRPLVRKFTKTRTEPTNADRCIGKDAVVIESIDNNSAKGQVKVGGIIWTARSSTGEIIEKDAVVKIEKIDGVKLIVSEKQPAMV